MSIEAITQVIDDRRFKGSTKLVLVALAWHAHKDGTNAYPLHKTLADETGMSVAAVRKALELGIRLGRIRREGKHPVTGRSADRWPSNYTIVMDDVSPVITRDSNGVSPAPPREVSPVITRDSNGVSPGARRGIAGEQRGVSPAITRTVSEPSKKREAQKRPLPDDFAISDAVRSWARATHPMVDIDRSFEKFLVHHQGTLQSNWDTKLRMWIANERDKIAGTPQTVRPLQPCPRCGRAVGPTDSAMDSGDGRIHADCQFLPVLTTELVVEVSR